ncbi:MAG: gfo/Idh/MocA family oxidoreductase [Alphaproteobacteria bacterium]|nr:gfo/Idh/MocA family oxidoreductase [Alphaproteobacteria bacterium]
MTDRPLRAAVVGAGVFGRLHAQKYHALPGVTLVAIVDADREKAQDAAQRFGASAHTRPLDLLGQIDCVSIAAPAEVHAPLAIPFLQAGIHVLVEKPIATSLEDTDRMATIAAENNLVLQTGHQERFVFAASGLLARKAAPRRIECHRAGPFSGRGTDVSVVLDLMTHDIDLVHALNPAPLRRVMARKRQLPGSFSDEVQAILTLEDGCKVNLTASRMAEEKRRFMRVLYDDGEVEIDFLARTVTNSTPDALAPAFFPSQDGKPGVADDPLGVAIAAFVEAVRKGSAPAITPAEARRTLETALMILRSAGSRAAKRELSAVA